MKYILSTILICLTAFGFSQATFKTHEVKKKETLYGISRQYKVTVEDITKANPELANGLKKGMKIKIPVVTSQTTSTQKTHKVVAGETAYSIARKYKISVTELVEANKGKTSNLSIGQELIIPVKNKVVGDAPVATNPTVSPKDGSVYVTKSGDTPYSIARKHNISLDELKKLNPNASFDNLPVGINLNVPTKAIKNTTRVAVKDIKNLNPEETKHVKMAPLKTDNGYIILEHTVEKGETLYGISKKYNTSIEEITSLNMEVINAGLKVGDRIKIKTKALLMQPKQVNNADYDSIKRLNPLVEDLDAMVKKDVYNVTMLLPFMIDKNAAIQKNKKINEPKKMYPLTEMSTHFYNGVKLALDTIKQTGLSINLNVFDTKKDSTYLTSILAKKEVKESDLIVGPFYDKTFLKATQYAKANRVQLVCPVEQSNKMLFNNTYVTKLKASLPTQAEYLAKYIAENFSNQNVILVAGKSEKDKYLADIIERVYNDSIKNKTNNFKTTLTRYDFASYRAMDGMKSKLVGDRENIILFPTTNKGLATSFFTQFNIVMNKPGMHNHKTAIYALENFKAFDNINIEHRIKYRLHITSSSFIDYKNENVKNFIKKYRATYGTHPNDFAFMGYDALVYNGLALHNYGKNHHGYYNLIQVPLLQTKANLKQKSPESGFENQHVYILSYDNYELTQVNE